MTALRLAALELRRFRGPLRRFVPLLLCLIPLLYGAMYLWANWDPYGRTSRIPVAVVDEDRPAHSITGEPVDAGAQLVQQLKASGDFGWRFVDADAAHAGLRSGRYFFVLHIPGDFSARLATGGTDRPEKAGITIELNDANNYIAGIMTEVVQSRLQAQVDSAAHAAYVRALYGELGGIRDRLATASDGAHRLQDATDTAGRGAAALTSGTTALHTGSAQVAAGSDSISAAVTQLDRATELLDRKAAADLPAAAAALVRTAELAADGTHTVHDTTTRIKTATGEQTTRLTALADHHPGLADDPAYQALLQQARQLDDTAGRLDAAATAADTEARQNLDHAHRLQDGVTGLQQHIQDARTPLRLVDTGTRDIADGARTATDGLTALQQAAQSLQTATGQAHAAAGTLTATTDEALRKIPPTDPDHVARAAEVLGTPVHIDRTDLHPAGVYGRGLAPFFFGIALWVFGLFAYLLLRPLNPRALAGRTPARTVALAGWLPGAALGCAGAVVLYAVVDLALGLHPRHPVLTLALLLLAAGSFVAVDHFLRTALGAPGDVLSLVLLILQLTASGGLYPMPTAPGFFQALNPLLPMTYLVDGLRVTISGGEPAHLVRDVLVLAAFAAAALTATTLTVRRHRTWTVARLHPDIAL
ncbi:YhgE/Pip family protein [Kitasatospora sp. NPDC093679]|uniref:YhgE/Pip domain-containing protein n=1 Tax=Kitasatospora sp. NPDC093679 TaxID=3154983 RepID=UPI0034425CD4